MASFSYNRAYTLTVEIPPTVIPPAELYANTPLENTSTVITDKDDFTATVIDKAIETQGSRCGIAG